MVRWSPNGVVCAIGAEDCPTETAPACLDRLPKTISVDGVRTTQHPGLVVDPDMVGAHPQPQRVATHEAIQSGAVLVVLRPPQGTTY